LFEIREIQHGRVGLLQHKLCEVLVRNQVAAPNPGLLAAMLKAQRLNGVMRWKVTFTESGFKGETNLAAWNGIWLETSAVKSVQEFVDVTANQTSNASLVGSTLAELVETLFSNDEKLGNACIAWSGWQDLLKSDPEGALEIAESLELACQANSAVVLVCDSVGSFPGISELSQG
jgi:hypothetical protein